MNLRFAIQIALLLGLTTASAPHARSGVRMASGYSTGNLVAKKPKPKPPEPRWPDGWPYIEPVQLELPL
jgi:hypothetical protein